ncbi:EAL domain-containing protein [Hungatella hathewayi]|uniref:EAL domain-containing protein n=1 Tax=Hungatella hathewayi TaxID=154046 RepID=UPI0035644BE0
MKRIIKRRLIIYFFVLALFLLISAVFGLENQSKYVRDRKAEAGSILELYKENITLIMREQLNYAQSLVSMEPGTMKDSEWFQWKVGELLAMEGVSSILVFDGDTVHAAFPESVREVMQGRNLKDLSYLYTLAKVVKEPVVEGPVRMEGTGEEVFLFLQPVLEGREYRGEIALALSGEYVIEKMNLESLHQQGYEYYLWKVSSQDGSKEVVASSNAKRDYSYAAKTEFYLPSQWNLSIIPIEGWVSGKKQILTVLESVLLWLLLSALFVVSTALVKRCRYDSNVRDTDWQTGLLNRQGIGKELNTWIQKGEKSFSVFYFALEDYNRIALLAGVENEEEYLKSIPVIMKDYIEGTYAAARISSEGFIVAVREVMTEAGMAEFAKGLSLKMIWKIRLQGRKVFLNTKYQYVSYPEEGNDVRTLLQNLIGKYYSKLFRESSVRELTEKCRQLAAGKSDVEFGEYAEPWITDLSQAINRYRKQVEQAVYYDPAFGIGNRMKYIRDVDMMITYDSKRRFRLYGVDIRSFGKYNELFSVETGDELLREITKRLSAIFGSNLYRINGDVFLGISLDHAITVKEKDAMISRIQESFRIPVRVNDAVITLDALIGICDYPANARTPEKLMECLQSAINYGKVPENGVADGIVVFNNRLLEIRRREGKILQLIRDSIQNETLEVWYQPIYKMKATRFTAAEALVRLPDGEGGYISAGQAIEVAERNGLVCQIGDYVINQACTFMKEKGEALGIERVGINLSVQQLLVEDSAAHLLEAIKKTGIRPEQVVLEITETILIQFMSKAEGIIRELSEYGIRISLDDFGIGYSSLNYLMNLPVHSLKIDRSMTSSIGGSQKQYALLKAIIAMAKVNEIEVVVEGVEKEEERLAIVSAEADYIQGFYYSKPLPQMELELFLREDNLQDTNYRCP